MPVTITAGTVSDLGTVAKVQRGYIFSLFDSNLFDNALHPVTGIATAGLHTKIRDLSATGKTFTPTLNRPGSARFSVPLTSADALDIVGYEIRRALVVYLDKFDGTTPTPVWSGYISNVQLSSSSQSVEVTATGWMQILYGREFRQAISFTSIDAGVIGTRLLYTANNQVANANVVTGSGGKSAEDLLLGNGELDNLGMLSGATSNLDAGFPVVDTTWARSGSSSIQIKSTNKNVQGSAGVNSGYDQTKKDQFPVDASSTYNVHAWINVTARSGASTAGVAINWYTAADALISQSISSVSATGEAEINANFSSPGTAAFGRLFLVNFTPAAGSITASLDAVTVSKTSVGLRSTPIALGTIDSPANPAGTNRTRTYAAGDKIGAAIEELSNIESGFDWEIGLRTTTVSGGITILREMNIKWTLVKAATTIRGIGTDRPDVIFGLSTLNNSVQDMTETRDGSSIATRVNGRSTGQLAMAQDLTAMGLYGLWEDSANISDPGIDANVLLGYAGAEVAYRSAPTRRFDLTPFPLDGTNKVPRLFIDYFVGDITYLSADYGAMQVGRENATKQPIRLFGITVSIDEEGNERLSDFKTTVSS